ncbi:MAG: glycosyltransferase family 9 protein [Magnetospirillum sp.]|nr:glycosyltransferase family 9 protein [Magnetospirillum sp.]
MTQAILVIRLGALGDFVQSAGPFAAIRAHHSGARITLLTTRPFAAFAAASPWFDEVWVDERPKFWQVRKVRALRDRLRRGGFQRVYDLQTSDRSSWYFRLMGGRVEWSGIARGCSHPHADPRRDALHTLERQAEQLAQAGIAEVPPPDLSWVAADIARYGLARPFVLLCPGGAPHRPAKRWPAGRFGELASRLADQGVTPVLLGTASERAALDAVRAACPRAVSLAGDTGLLEIVALARAAMAAVGNDTGPMHLIAAAGCASVVLFSSESDPALCAPRGRVSLLRRDRLDALATAEVVRTLAALT